MQKKDGGGQMSLFAQDGYAGRTCPAPFQVESRPARISASSWKRSSALVAIPFLSLDLTPGNGNLLGEFYWETLSPWLGGSWTLNTGPAPPSGAAGSTLSQILQAQAPRKYYLTDKACLGILRRSRERGKPLPPQLETALKIQAGLVSADHLSEQPVAAFCAGAGAKAGGISYSEEVSPTLKACQSGNMAPAVLCLNDQGGRNMDVTTDCTGTLRAQEHGHQPLVFENHNLDARYDGPLDVVPTLCTRAGTGGNNLPLIAEQDVVGALTARDCKGADNIYAEQGKLVVEPPHLIRRLMPGECELLQGYPPDWTALPGASDSARYRALGNSVSIPCVEFVLGGIAKFAEGG